MIPGGLLDLLLLATAGAAGVAGVWAARAPDDATARRLHASLAVGALAAAALAYLFLVTRFLWCDVAYEHVFLYTRCDLPLRYRLAGAWTGREGSLLLWTLWQCAVAAAVAAWHRRRPAADAAEAQARAWTGFLLSALALAFAGAAAWQQTFRPTPDYLLAGRPEGNGMNPLLLSPFILIHPPLMFAAYALAAVPAAAALAHLATGTDRWSRVALPWSRVDWLLYTAAMGLGALWAYYTLSFGGYWAWDPVEVANLLPWLALTLYLHAQLHHRRHGAYRAVGPFLALLPFLLTLFSTVSTRSGLWVSVHAFTDPTNTFDPDAPARFLAILAAEPGLRFFAGLFLATFALGLGLWARRLAADTGALARSARVVAAVLGALAGAAVVAPRAALSAVFEGARLMGAGDTGLGLLGLTVAAVLAAAAPVLVHDPAATADGPAAPARRRWGRDRRTRDYAAILLLGLGLLLLFLFHMQAVRGWSEAFYLRRLPFLAAPALLGILLLAGHGAYGRGTAIAVAAAALAAAGAATLVLPSHRAGAFLVVLSGAAVAVAFDRVRRAAQRPAPASVQLGWALLLLAAALDVLFWLNPPAILGGLWRPRWPVQAVFGVAALLAVLLALREAALAPDARRGRAARAAPYVLAGLLGAYYVAPVLAAAAWLLARRAATEPDASAAQAARADRAGRAGRARLDQAALYGLHFAVALVLLGYAASTYFRTADDVDVPVGGTARLGAATLRLDGVALHPEAGTPWAGEVRPAFEVLRGDAVADASRTVAPLSWEPQTGSHYPLPATVRLWDRDVYWSVQSVCTDPTGACSDAADRTDAFATTGRVPAAAEVTQVRISAVELPGLPLLWGAWAFLVGAMALRMAMARPE